MMGCRSRRRRNRSMDVYYCYRLCVAFDLKDRFVSKSEKFVITIVIVQNLQGDSDCCKICREDMTECDKWNRLGKPGQVKRLIGVYS